MRVISIILGLIGLAACAGAPEADMMSADTTPRATVELRGSAFYRERMLVPSGTEFTVSLREAAMVDAGVLATHNAPVEGGGPFEFVLRYDPAALDEGADPVLIARLELGDRILFQSEPVRTDPGDAIIVLDPILMRSTVRSMFDGPTANIPEDLTGKRWIAEDIGGAGVMDMLQSALEFSATGQVSGNTGCNQLNGRFQAVDGQLHFGPLATTRRGCTGAIMDQEQRFLAALEATARYRIDETGGLALLAADGAVLVRLVAEN